METAKQKAYYRDYRAKNYDKLYNRFKTYDATNPVRKIKRYEYHDNNIHTWDEQKRLWIENNYELRLQTARDWAKRNRHKTSMVNKSRKLLEEGILRRTPCPCGNPETIIFHYDYESPMHVRFLCKNCANTERKAIRRRARLAEIIENSKQ